MFNCEALQVMEDMTDSVIEIEAADNVASLSNYKLNEVEAQQHERDYLLPAL